MAFSSRNLLAFAMVVLVATSNHQVHAFTCATVEAALSLGCNGILGGILALINALVTGLLTGQVPGQVPGLTPGDQCCSNLRNMYGQASASNFNITACLPFPNLNLLSLCASLETCAISAEICASV